MPSPTTQAHAGAARDRLFWAALGTLAVGLLVAFWIICEHQVRKAQMRDVSLEVQRVAIADCLQYVPRATLSSCANRVDPGRREASAVLAAGSKPPAAADAARGSMSNGAAVSISYR